MGGRCGGRSVGQDRCEITSGALHGIGNAVSIQQAAFQGDGGRPVEVLQAAGLPEAGALQPQFNAPVGAAIDLVAEDDLQEGCIVQLLSADFCGGRLLPGRGQGYSPLTPNPPKDTAGRREDSGGGVRELQGR